MKTKYLGQLCIEDSYHQRVWITYYDESTFQECKRKMLSNGIPKHEARIVKICYEVTKLNY